MTDSDAQPLYVVFTMDCVPPDGPPSVPGPPSWREAEDSVRAVRDVLRALGMTGTFFIAPECLARMNQTVVALAEAGMELGILCHPQLSGYQSYFGSYGFDRQREIVQLGKQIWRNRIGTLPTAFRAGYFSANNCTYHVLCLEGFSESSCVLPGCVDPDRSVNWHRVYPFPHHTDPLDCTLKGTLEVFEAPVTSAFAAKEYVKADAHTPLHMRVEAPEFEETAEKLLVEHLSRMLEDRTDVRTVVCVTSNTASWSDHECTLARKLGHFWAAALRFAMERGMKAVPATLRNVHRAADERFTRASS
jgi:hypothetical protein